MSQFEMDAVTPQNSGENNLWIRFFMDAEQDMEASEAQGRPIFKESEFIEIRIPGNKDEIRVRPVRFADTQQFPRQYGAFKQGLADPVIGTPLDKIPFITKAQAAEFNALGVKTAEQLRDMADGNAQRIMGAQALKTKVANFLAAAEGAAPALKLQSELEKRDGEIEVLKGLVEAQNKKIDELARKRA